MDQNFTFQYHTPKYKSIKFPNCNHYYPAFSFFYPGMKLKDAVRQSARIAREKNLKLGITKPLSYHPRMRQLIVERINWLKKNNGVDYLDKECDVMLIGHGSSDRNAHDAFV